AAGDHAGGGRGSDRPRPGAGIRDRVGAAGAALGDDRSAPRPAPVVPQAPPLTMHEAPRHGERVVAAFDFDKTISTRDNVVPFLRAVVGRTRLTRALLALGPRLVRAALNDERRDAAKVALVRRTLAGYDAGRI